jgi:hypothetical protein
MTPAWEVTTIALRVWLFGLLVVSFVSLSDFVFRRPHSVRVLLKRLATGLIWPLALASSEGRNALLGRFRGV